MRTALERVRVLIERDASTTLSVDAWAYELSILAAIHGDEMIHEKGTTTVTKEWNAQSAHEALRRKYGDETVKRVYPTVQSLARVVEPSRKRRQESEPEPQSEPAIE